MTCSRIDRRDGGDLCRSADIWPWLQGYCVEAKNPEMRILARPIKRCDRMGRPERHLNEYYLGRPADHCEDRQITLMTALNII